VALGFGDKILATDRFSDDVAGIADGISGLDLISLDAEFVMELNPDIVFVTGMTRVSGDEDPLYLVSDAGIAVIYMPISASIDAIIEDIRFLSAVMDVREAGEDIISDMQAELDAIREVAATISEARTVYFEISPVPHMWTLGENTFINEMIELIGAVNIFADKDGWVSVADEALLEANPDVIITSVDLDDAVAEIMNRPGWSAIAAVQNGNVFQVSTNYTNRPSQNIIKGLREISLAVFPDYFQ
jgi:iron complex transport system substrate-binding protein